MRGQSQTFIGLDWLKHIKINWAKMFNVVKIEHKSTVPLSETLRKFKEVFGEGHGTVKTMKNILIP